jgi:hypothetical protein
MIIHQPEVKIENGEVSVSARVEFSQPMANIPKALWYRFPEAYAGYITEHSDGFIVSLLLLAMAMGEEVTVRGTTSPRLAYGLEQYQKVFNAWFPRQFTQIGVAYERIEALLPEQGGKQVVSSFSGGVDSTFTLMEHLPPEQVIPEFQVSHCVFVQGFDIPLWDTKDFQQAALTFSKVLSSMGVELIPCKTNVHSFTTGRVKWDYSHGGAIAAPALFLQGLVKNYLISSSWSLIRYEHWGSSPFTDPWLSTETIEMIYFGASYPRMEKVAAISSWRPAGQFLRVCTNLQGRHGVQNCSRCEKCLRTMIMLKVTGGLEYYKTFNRTIRKIDFFRWMPAYVIHCPELMNYIIAYKKYEYIPYLVIPSILGWAQYLLKKFIPHWLFNWLKKRAYPVLDDPFSYNQLPDAMKNDEP